MALPSSSAHGRSSIQRFRHFVIWYGCALSSSRTGILRRCPMTMTSAAAEILTPTVAIATTMATGRASLSPVAVARDRRRRASAALLTPGLVVVLVLRSSHVSVTLASWWANSAALSCRRTLPYPAPQAAAGFPDRGRHAPRPHSVNKLTCSLGPLAHTLLSNVCWGGPLGVAESCLSCSRSATPLYRPRPEESLRL